MDTISAESERVAFLRFLNLYFRLGIAICDGLPRDGGYILKVFYTLTPSKLHVAWDGILKTSVWVGGYRSYFLLFYAMLAQLLEVEAILQLQNLD